jgi:hypothetical protein
MRPSPNGFLLKRELDEGRQRAQDDGLLEHGFEGMPLLRQEPAAALGAQLLVNLVVDVAQRVEVGGARRQRDGVLIRHFRLVFAESCAGVNPQ